MKKIRMKIGKLLLLVMMFMALSPALAEAAEVPARGQLTIHNYDRNQQPVAGVTYTLWQVDEGGDYRPETAREAKNHLLTATRQEQATGTDGKAVFTDLGIGIYYVEETDLGAYNDRAFFNEPFLIEMPMTNEAGDGWVSDIEVFLKNPYLHIDKFVGPAGTADYDFADRNKAKHRPVAAGEVFGWSILSGLPAGIGETAGETYMVTDGLGTDFTYLPGTVRVYLLKTQDTPCAEGVLLTENKEYAFSHDSGSNTLQVSLTSEGLELIRQRDQSEAVKDGFVLIKFDATLSDTAPQGQNLYNGASVSYSKAADPRTRNGELQTIQTTVTEEPEVHTGQILITKVEKDSEKLLAGAEFGVALSEADAKAGNFAATAVSDSEGQLTFKGLAYGQPGDDSAANSANTVYWLRETKAPQGYVLLEDPIEVAFQRQLDEVTGQCYFAKVKVYNAPEEPTETESESNTEVVKKPGTNPPGRNTPDPRPNIVTRNVRTGDNSPILILTGAVLLSCSVLLLALKRRKHPAKK